VKATIGQGFKAGMSEEEKERLLLQVRTALNGTVRRFPAAVGSAGSAVTLFTSDALEPGERVVFKVEVHGLDAAGTIYLYGQYAGMFRRLSTGAAIQLGTTRILFEQASAATQVVSLAVTSDSQITVTATDGGAGSMTWSCWVEMFTS
jgi:hypothetical protein